MLSCEYKSEKYEQIDTTLISKIFCNKVSHWLPVSGSKMQGDYSGNIKMPSWVFGQTLQKGSKFRKSEHLP